jgi:hypothetical protein
MTSLDSSSITPAPPAPERELHCPICDYDLHGLPSPRCPECGFRFEWEELLREQVEYPDFFETARGHLIRAFERTLARSALSLRFWWQLRPTSRPRSRRLIVYVILVTTIGLIGALVIAAAPLYEYIQWNLTQRALIITSYSNPRNPDDIAYAQQLARPFGSVQKYVDWAYPPPTSIQFWRRTSNILKGRAFLPAIVLAWPIITFLALMIFRVSLMTARISPGHVLRCTAYSADAVAWLLALALVTLPFINRIDFDSVLWTGYLPILLHIWLSARLLISYQLYLRINRGLAMAITSQLMAALLFSKLALWLNGY